VPPEVKASDALGAAGRDISCAWLEGSEMPSLFSGFVASWRFGRAGKLQARGDFEGALALYGANRTALAAASMDPPDLSLRAHNLIRIAQVSLQLGRHELMVGALKEWTALRDLACTKYPAYDNAEVFTRYQSWAERTLQDSVGGGNAGHGNPDPK